MRFERKIVNSDEARNLIEAHGRDDIDSCVYGSIAYKTQKATIHSACGSMSSISEKYLSPICFSGNKIVMGLETLLALEQTKCSVRLLFVYGVPKFDEYIREQAGIMEQFGCDSIPFGMYEIVDSDLAEDYLSSSKGNRNIKRETLKSYIRDMENGDWKLNCEAIQFDKHGHLINGHHRLKACEEIDFSIPFYVVKGINDDVSLFDRGATRRSQDVFYFKGLPPWFCSAIVIGCVNYCFKVERNFKKVTDSEREEFIKKNETSVKFIHENYNKGRSGKKLTMKASILSAVFYAHKYGVDESILTHFIEIVNTGVNYDRLYSAAVVLRNMLLSEGEFNSTAIRKKYFNATQEAIQCIALKKERKLPFKGEGGFYFDEVRKREQEAEA